MKIVTSAAAALALLGAASAAHAGPATDALGQCLVQSSTGKDRVVFVQWLFSTLSVHPNVGPMANVTPAQRTELTRQAAAVMDRLVLADCHAEAVAAVKADGQDALGTSFEAFGQAAATELFSNPKVDKEMSAISDHVDLAKWADLISQAKK